MTQPFFTVGHSNRSFDELVELLKLSDVGAVADVRRFPMSRTNPQFNADVLDDSLAGAGIAYRHIAELGGLRGKTPHVPAETNAFWRNKSFHRYADYALAEPFRAGIDDLVEWGHQQRTAIMCSEALWWRCHRRIIADYLLARGEAVFHIMARGRTEAAQLTSGAVARPGGAIVYAAQA